MYFFCAMATMLTMTAAIKAMDGQRWVCRILLFEFNGTSYERAAKGFSPQRPQYRWKSGPCRAAQLSD